MSYLHIYVIYVYIYIYPTELLRQPQLARSGFSRNSQVSQHLICLHLQSASSPRTLVTFFPEERWGNLPKSKSKKPEEL